VEVVCPSVAVEMVRALPPTVETITTPTALVVVMTWPAVREMDPVEAEVTGTVVDDPPATAEVVEPTTGEPLEEMMDVVLTAESPPAGEELGNGSDAIGGTGVTDRGPAGAVVVVVPLSCRFTISFLTRSFVRLANSMMLVAREGSSLWITSTAVWSVSNMPCLNFLGEKL